MLLLGAAGVHSGRCAPHARRTAKWMRDVAKPMGMGPCCPRTAGGGGGGYPKKSRNRCFLIAQEALGGCWSISARPRLPSYSCGPKAS